MAAKRHEPGGKRGMHGGPCGACCCPRYGCCPKFGCWPQAGCCPKFGCWPQAGCCPKFGCWPQAGCCPQFCGGPPRSPQPAPCWPPPNRAGPTPAPRCPGSPPRDPPGLHGVVGEHCPGGAALATPWPNTAANARLPHITVVAIIVRCRMMIFIVENSFQTSCCASSRPTRLTPQAAVRSYSQYVVSEIDARCQTRN
jgi:hypothetical protein